MVKGLSHRAYRKEITRGIDEVSARLRQVEEGRWCEDREPVLKAYVAGTADADQRRQAEQHLAHCRHCTEYVGKLSGHLHEIGSSIAWTGAAHAIDDRPLSMLERVGGALDRVREAVTGRGVPETSDAYDHTGRIERCGARRGRCRRERACQGRWSRCGAENPCGMPRRRGGGHVCRRRCAPGRGASCARPQAAERHLADTGAGHKQPKFYDTIPAQSGHETPVPSADDSQQQPAPEPEPEPAPAPQPAPAPAPSAPAAEFDASAAPSTTSSGEFGPSSTGGSGGGSSAGAEFGGP